MILVCDIDGTLADTEHWILSKEFLMDPDGSLAFAYPPLQKAAEVLPALIEALKKQSEGNLQVAYVTCRPESLRYWTEKWLNKHFPTMEGYPLYMRPMEPIRDGEHPEITDSIPCCDWKGTTFHFLAANHRRRLAFDDRIGKPAEEWEKWQAMYASMGYRLFEAPKVWSDIKPYMELVG